MKKIIILIALLLFAVVGVTWFYFKNLSVNNNKSVKILSLVPNDAPLVFEYKNETSFYQIFRNFTLFKDVLGNNCFNQLSNLNKVFIKNTQVSKSLINSNLYFSIHKTTPNNAGFLVYAPLNSTFTDANSTSDFIRLINNYFPLKNTKLGKEVLYSTVIQNSSFYFIIYQNIIIGSFDITLLQKSISYINGKNKNNPFKAQTQRSKNSIANLYINFEKLPYFINNFSRYKNPENTKALKNFNASSNLNINYQSNAFMFSGITIPDTTKQQYLNLFLKQQPGIIGIQSVIPLDVASYTAYYVSDILKFNLNLTQLFKQQNIYQNLKNQINNISKAQAIDIEKEFLNVLGNDFGVVQLASGSKIGLVSTKNSKRFAFILSTISNQNPQNISRFKNANFLFYFFGEPFKTFNRPYFTVINNYLAVCNSQQVLQNYVNSYNQQQTLITNSKYISFQQYLSNKGNIFYFYHNKNSQSIIKGFLSTDAYNAYNSKTFGYKNIYGLSLQLSADNNKFYTNLYMNIQQNKNQNSFLSDSLYLDSLTQQNKN